jgi:hypothetical protein
MGILRSGPILLVALLVACGIDKADIGTDTPPLIQRDEGTSPADSTGGLHDPDGLDLVVNFNRPLESGEVSHLQIVPRPARLGAVENPSGNPRQIVFRNVVLDPVYPAYRLVMDGTVMPAPVILSYYSEEYSPVEAAIQGRVFISRGRTEPVDVLVYALVPLNREDDFPLTGAEETIMGRPVVGVTKTLMVPTEEGGWYHLAGLAFFTRYLVFAILDTSRDGRYDPEVDWWGFYAGEDGVPIEVEAGIVLGELFEPPLSNLRDDIDFWLLAPGSVDPGLE